MKKRLLFILLFSLFFSGAFTMFFFDDDYYFLKRSTVHSLSQFFRLFLPANGTFYRPFSSELFYLIIHIAGSYIGKAAVITVFLTGIYFMYRIIHKLSGKVIGVLAVILYAFHFSHVFQLYWFATFQEVALFATLSASFYFYITERRRLSFFLFVIALFCKEQAVLYPVFVLVYELLKKKGEKREFTYAMWALVVSILMVPLYWPGLKTNAALPEYQIRLSPRLIFNNTLWYSLWSLGFPSMMSDYMTSLIKPPLPQFYRFFQNPVFTAYFILMLGFIAALTGTAFYVLAVRRYRINLNKCILLAAGFLLFLSPTLPIFHKWMVRLTLPLIFVSVAEAALLALLYRSAIGRKVTAAIVSLYLVFNFLGVKVHEDISTYKLETRITRNAASIFAAQKKPILASGRVAIVDDSGREMSAWAGVDKLKVTFAGQNASAYYFPEKKVDFLYVGKSEMPPKDAVIVPASAFFK